MTALEVARAALESGDFESAVAALTGIPRTVEVLEVLAPAAYGAGDLELAIGSWERLHVLHAEDGRDAEAALAAAFVALHLLCETGLMAPVRGWVARARRYLAEDEPGPAHALLAIISAYERFLSGDPSAALGPAMQAVELGTRLGVDPARGLGRVALARLAIHDGDSERGIALLDELAVDLAAGEFDPLTTGNVYCELICAAQWLGRHDRAREWTEVMERWRHGPALGATHGRCRIHRAELLRVSGPADEAEAEALAACAELRPWMRRELGWPLVELGNIRLRRGDLAGAEEAFLEAHQRAWCAQPGMALLRLAQGDVRTAATMIRTEIAHPSDLPWKERPPFGDLRLVPLLVAQVEIAEVAGDRDTASSAAAALELIAARHPSAGTRAEAALARTRALLLTGEAEAALGHARVAVAAWAELEAPYDTATARVLLGRAHAELGEVEQARMEWASAAAAFTAFGAGHRAAEVERLLGPTGAGSGVSTAGPPAVRAVLLREGDHWRVGCGEREAWVADLKGIRLLARLLAEPGREVHVLDLVDAGVVSAGLPVLDDQARAAYRRRLAEVEADIEEAARNCDEVRREHAERDRDYLLAELGGALGLGGRPRVTGGTVERARTSTTRSLRYAIARVAEQLPELGEHLAGAVRTGTSCCYRPDPVAPLAWEVRS